MRFHQNILTKFKKSTPEPIKENFEDEIMSFFIHTADLSGAAKKYELSEVWAKKINQEFSSQYDEEIRLGLPSTAHFKGLDDDSIFHKNEFGFRKFIILPLYETMKALDDGFFVGKKKGLKVVNPVKGRKAKGLIVEEVARERTVSVDKKKKKNQKRKASKKKKKNIKDTKKQNVEKKGKMDSKLI